MHTKSPYTRQCRLPLSNSANKTFNVLNVQQWGFHNVERFCRLRLIGSCKCARLYIRLILSMMAVCNERLDVCNSVWKFDLMLWWPFACSERLAVCRERLAVCSERLDVLYWAFGRFVLSVWTLCIERLDVLYWAFGRFVLSVWTFDLISGTIAVSN